MRKHHSAFQELLLGPSRNISRARSCAASHSSLVPVAVIEENFRVSFVTSMSNKLNYETLSSFGPNSEQLGIWSVEITIS